METRKELRAIFAHLFLLGGITGQQLAYQTYGDVEKRTRILSVSMVSIAIGTGLIVYRPLIDGLPSVEELTGE